MGLRVIYIVASLDDLCGYGYQNKRRITKMKDDEDNGQSVRCDEGGLYNVWTQEEECIDE